MKQEIGYNQGSVSADQRPQDFQFDLSGGHLALDFANSISRRDSPQNTTDHLKSYHDLIAFARQSKVITPEDSEALRHKAQTQARHAAHVLGVAIALRGAIFSTFLALAHGKQPSSHEIARIEKAAADALQHRHIVRLNGKYEWRWDAEPMLEGILWPIAQSAAELLTSADLAKVRECEGSDCYWLFLDNSRNRSRRWCTMSSCGNREKARRHYRRQHSP